MAKKLTQMGGLMLSQGEGDTSWLRYDIEFRGTDYVFLGRPHQNPEIGIIHTLAVDGLEIWPKTFCISATAFRRSIFISSNMGYDHPAPQKVNFGRIKNDDTIDVAEELQGIDMKDYPHTFSLGTLLDVHRERIVNVDDLLPELSQDAVEEIYGTLVYKSPRFP